MNDWLIIVAFGLAIVDYTAFAVLKVPSLAPAAASDHPAMSRDRGKDVGFQAPEPERSSNGAAVDHDRWAMPLPGTLDRSRGAL